MLSITADFKIEDIQKDFMALEENIKQDIIRGLSNTLEQLVDRARAKTKDDYGFGNITWDLRSSIGGVIVAGGQIVFRYFPTIGKGDNGHKTGNAFAEEIANLVNDHDEITLIFVAGMDYGRFVETQGHDVITGTSFYIEEYLKKNLSN